MDCLRAQRPPTKPALNSNLICQSRVGRPLTVSASLEWRLKCTSCSAAPMYSKARTAQ